MHTTSTDCHSLDRLLDGGLESDAITLVFGEGGSGKTNLALQCARVVAGAGRRVAYIDTEGVSHKRLAQVFEVLPVGDRGPAEERLLFFTPYTIEEQEKMVKRTSLLRDVGLIVVDSINMHYRLHIDGPGAEKEASRSLYQQLHHLTMHARQHDIPVLITGQVYGGEDATQPFARRVMEHLVKALVRFEKRPDGTRRATVLKHRSIEEGRQTRFRIGGHGLEDLDETRAAAAGADAPASAQAGGGSPVPDGAPRGEARGDSRPPGSDEASGPPDRGEARREADAWGVEADEADRAGGDGTGAGPEADDGGGAWRDPASNRGATYDAAAPTSDQDATAYADAGVPADEPGALEAHGTARRQTGGHTRQDWGAPGTEPEGDPPATSLLTAKERRDAESLPGFTPATALHPPEPSGGDAEGR